MTGFGTGVLLGAASAAELCATWAVILSAAAVAYDGWRRGGFRAVIAGLQVLAAWLAAMALAGPFSGVAAALGCPAGQALAVGFWIPFLLGIVGSRIAVDACVPGGAVRLTPVLDRFTGAGFGLVAGVLLGGGLLVGWSMLDVAGRLRLVNTERPIDQGVRMLRTFARFAAGGEAGRRLVEGDRPAAAGDEPRVIRASEPFADSNSNGIHDEGEAGGRPAESYLDVDGDGAFSRDLAWIDADDDGRRTIGLQERYWLADWPRARVMHAPRIVSGGTAEVVEHAPLEQTVYEAKATDADGDAVTFAVEPAAAATEGAAPGVVIDSATGAVTLLEPADFERAKTHDFVLVATDATGLVTRQPVRVRVRDVLIEPAPAP